MKKMNSSGKVLIVFSVITAILLISLTAISLFFFQKEIERRKTVQEQLDQSVAKEKILQVKVEDAEKKITLLEAKNKEADERINNLLDEIELQEGLREEMKIENLSLNQEIEKIKKKNEELENKKEEALALSQQKMDDLQNRLKVELDEKQNIQKELSSFKEMNDNLKKNVVSLEENIGTLEKELNKIKGITGQDMATGNSDVNQEIQKALDDQTDNNPTETAENVEEIDLDKIIVSQSSAAEGRILSVDQETDFVIISIGEKDGLSVGNTLSVYRGKNYLGDIKVTRIQPSMSAADIIPPFTSKLIRKNDLVVLKK